MHSAAARIGGLVIGLFIIVLGLSLLMDDAGMDTSARTKALIYALTALGIGVTAAALLPNTLTISGEKIKPLGANFQATGGAAFFVATLIFLFYTEDKGPQPNPTPQATETMASGPQSELPDITDDEDSEPAPQQSQAPVIQPDPVQPQQPVQQMAALQPGFIANPYGPAPANPNNIIRVRTYCTDCCPGGPMPCGQVGGAQSFDVDEAELGAYTMCINNGGYEAPCLMNLERF
ncbi:hypothetical protein [Parerythrobacter jejuensis]|uniref:Uncharacterized protein n=1 Tax=Parerythrobacter jejuensis TaxID=795812 RepID=A0A845AUS4_9SPHN|nr:hypothetical protein [Parerythrobacter jejuensis]MXP31350.1 hypothetical protein [Parerythrobacter jejuensis]MXP34110.1 hypothetical protein [Parerythrobacter jejuensis]